MQESTRKKLRRLSKLPAIIGLLLIIKPIIQFLAYVTNVDFYISVSGNPRMVSIWNFFATPYGNMILILIGFLIIAYLIVRPEKDATPLPASDGALLPEKSLQEISPVSTEQEPQASISQEPEPNLVLKQPANVVAHFSNGILNEGRSKHHYKSDRPSVLAAVAEISNEFSTSRKVGEAQYITAQIIYRTLDGTSIQVNRGAWLSRANKAFFEVNHVQKLVIAYAYEIDSQVFIFVEDYEDFKNIEDIIRELKGDSYDVEVRVISESKGVMYLKLNFKLTITRQPEFKMELRESQA